MSAVGGVGEVDRDLGVLDPPGGAGVLALHSHGVHTLLQIAGFIDHQHPVGIAEVSHDVVAQIVPDPIGVPARAGQEVLHAIRIGIPGVFGDAPTVLARQIRQQSADEPPGPAAGLHPDEPGRHPIEQLVGLSRPPGGLYAVAHGHRLIFRCRHNGRGSRGGRPLSETATPEDHDLQLEY
jgi:hypothetical protein